MFTLSRWTWPRWIPTLMPYFVMLNYFMDLLYSLVHFSHLGKQRAVVMNVTNVFGYIYTVFDMFLILVSLILTLGTRIEESGVILLLIGRVIHRLLLSIWSMLLYYLFSECQDMGCLLMLLATKAKMHAEKGCPKMEVSSYHLLLLGARLCLCCMFLIWMDEDLNVIFNILSLLLFISIGLGFYCKVCSYLTLLVLMYHDIFSNHWSMLFGWNDYFLSMNYFAMFFGKIGAFLMLSELGAGKWSMDSYLGLNDYERDQKGGYKIIKEQATA
ncbi:uncharacterized protein [Drosophila kikkawai]|uniref:Uncharacterized protein n=1 Tax=Drosophila kikkawai TaxID=30033 RepID=A0A6P4I9G6_DROKI|nr:uncharacterized protein LOC108076975 [Drosophila kikkawai]